MELFSRAIQEFDKTTVRRAIRPALVTTENTFSERREIDDLFEGPAGRGQSVPPGKPVLPLALRDFGFCPESSLWVTADGRRFFVRKPLMAFDKGIVWRLH